MAIKDILDRIQTNLGEAITPEVKALLADAKREADDILDSKSAVDRESKSRKEKIRELEAQLETAKTEASKAQSPEALAELKRLKEIETKHNAMLADSDAKLKATWAEKSKILTQDKTSKLYDKVEKVKARFITAQEGTELTSDDIRKNLDTFELLESTAYFTTEPVDTGGKAPANPANQSTTYKSSGEAINALLGYK